MDPMKAAVSFEQFCPVAVSLDALGDQWSLLLMRDLLWAGPQSQAGLIERNPSLDASNLDDTLVHLISRGLVRQLDEPKARYALTERGEGISEVINALFTFGLPLLADVVMTPWMLSYAIADCSRRKRMELMEVEERMLVRFVVDETQTVVEVSPGLMREVDGLEPHATVRTSGPCLAKLLAGAAPPAEMVAAGEVGIDGDREVADRFLAILPADH
ncbi:MAG: winged helix-turn-helix transcriptional regulator [Actinomycetota bacterium]